MTAARPIVAALLASLTLSVAAEAGDDVALPTLGGRQVWGDVEAHAGWRIQENAVTGHFRLLDPDDWRHAWGSLADCQAALVKVEGNQSLHWPGRHLVVMVHGLGRTRASFDRMAEDLGADGFATLAISYPSTRGSAADHGARLTALLNRLRGIDRVSFVTHSYGGLVLRHALGTAAPWRSRITAGRAVLLAPPSQGSAIADRLRDAAAFRLFAGPGGQAVTPEQAQALPAPTIPFGIIAGGRGDGEGYNPWLPGDDDGVVAVAETRLAGADDFLVLDVLHTFIMRDMDAIDAVKRFLKDGRFRPPPAAAEVK